MKKFNRFGALAQLVEQWPFKPFVTGSNPVRPSFVLSILLTVLSLNTEIAIAENTLLNIKSDNNILLTGNLLSDQKNESVFLILHGTRGYKAMEIITSLAQRIYEEGHDTLRINLSYGINNREDTFLSCDIKHQHKEYESISEIINLSGIKKSIDFINIDVEGNDYKILTQINIHILKPKLISIETHNVDGSESLNFLNINDYLSKNNFIVYRRAGPTTLFYRKK